MEGNFDISEAIRQKKPKVSKLRGKPIHVNTGLELDYYRKLKFMLEQMNERFINVVIEGLDTKAVSEVIHDESVASKINRLLMSFKQMIKGQFDNDRLLKTATLLITQTDRTQRVKFVSSVDYGFGINVSAIPEFKAYKQFINMAIKRNLALIKSLRDENLTKLEVALRTSIEQGKSIPQIKKIILNNYKVSKKRAATIARNEIKNVTALLNKKRMQNVGFEMYTWQTAEDERVRGNPSGLYPKSKPSHYKMDGLICRFDNPSVYSVDGKKWKPRTQDMPKEHPGEQINCRCIAVAYIDLYN